MSAHHPVWIPDGLQLPDEIDQRFVPQCFSLGIVSCTTAARPISAELATVPGKTASQISQADGNCLLTETGLMARSW